MNGFFFFFPFLFYVLIKSRSGFGVNPMASFLGLEQIWIWVKKLPILFFAISFISFEPKLKMAAIATSISSTSLFSPYTLARPKTHTPCFHSTHRWQIEVAPPHTSSKVWRPPTLRCSSTPHSDATPTQLHPTLRSHTHLQHLWSVIGEANLWIWVLICGGEAWLIWVWILRSVTCRLRFGFWWWSNWDFGLSRWTSAWRRGAMGGLGFVALWVATRRGSWDWDLWSDWFEFSFSGFEKS